MNWKGKGLMVGVAALVVFLASCEKDIPENMGGGKKVEILFSINTTNYHSGGDVVRSAGALEQASTTMYINDSIYLRTTLVPDLGDELRAPVAFTDGQKICFEAYNVSSPAIAVDSKIYSWSTSAGKFIPDTDPLGVVPDGATTYRFVAYSYFGETGVTPVASSINPSHDLVWGRTLADQTITDTEVSRTVSISMTHKFARVRVRMRSTEISGATITTLSGVTVEGGTLSTLTPFDGGISSGSAATQGVSITVPSPAVNDMYSLYRTVTPVAAPVQVKVGSLKVSVSGTTFSNRTVSFNSALAVGTSYTLVVDVKRILFARSNIYWDGSKMTFVPAGTDNSKEGYQGLFFKYGSLVGISPVGSWVNSSTRTYKAGASTYSTYSSYSSIPYTSGSNVSGAGYSVSSLRGDICQYINSAYHIPTPDDFTAVSNDWTTHGGSGGTGNDTGTYDLISNGYKYSRSALRGDLFLPYTGGLGEVGQHAGDYFAYWTGIVSGVSYMIFGSTFAVSAGHSSLGFDRYALAVRCVKN